MRIFSLKGILAYGHAVKQALQQEIKTPKNVEERKQVEYVCAHYTVMGLSFVVRLRDGTLIQKKTAPTKEAIAEMFSTLGG